MMQQKTNFITPPAMPRMHESHLWHHTLYPCIRGTKIRALALITACLFMAVFAKAQNAETIKDYINTYRILAIKEMQRTGVPAAIKLAQGIHESMAGKSDLVQQSNNHFGIKCKEGYSGPYVLHDDDRPQERFMKYEKPEQSFIDHSDFLKNRSRYASLFELDPTDYKSWAYGLKKAGYATNPRYAQIIIRLIEDYHLEDYTLMALGKMPVPDNYKEVVAETPVVAKAELPVYPTGEFKINKTRVVFAKKGTAIADLAQQYNIPLSRLYDCNDFTNNTPVLAKDQLVYLQLKRTLSDKAWHEVQEGESIYDIAQAEGIRLESLLKYNNLTKFTSPAIGSKLLLQEAAGATGSN